MPRAAGAWRAATRRSARGPPPRKAEAVKFADDGITGDADLSGDLTARQAAGGKVAELLDALRSPSLHAHNLLPLVPAAGSGPPTGPRPPNRRPPKRKAPPFAERACGLSHYVLVVFSLEPVCRAGLSLLSENPRRIQRT